MPFSARRDVFGDAPLHVYRDSLETFESAPNWDFRWPRPGFELAETEGVYVAYGEAGLCHGLGLAILGWRERCGENGRLSVTRPRTEFLENSWPRKTMRRYGEARELTGEPSGLFENAADIGQEEPLCEPEKWFFNPQ